MKKSTTQALSNLTAFASIFTTEETTEIRANKEWTIDDGGTRADSVTVQLYCDGQPWGDPVTLSDSNDWTTLWEELPVGHSWSVVEINVPAGFTSSVTQEDSVITITNDDIPTDIPDPERPDPDPEDPDPEPDDPTDIPDPENQIQLRTIQNQRIRMIRPTFQIQKNQTPMIQTIQPTFRTQKNRMTTRIQTSQPRHPTQAHHRAQARQVIRQPQARLAQPPRPPRINRTTRMHHKPATIHTLAHCSPCAWHRWQG